MNDPSATDVITFEGNLATGQAGEIVHLWLIPRPRYVGLGSSRTDEHDLGNERLSQPNLHFI